MVGPEAFSVHWRLNYSTIVVFCCYMNKLSLRHITNATEAPRERIMAPSTGRRLALLFFSETRRSETNWKCNACNKEVSQYSGYSNLCAHISTNYSDEVKTRLEINLKRSWTSSESLQFPKKDTYCSRLAWERCISASAIQLRRECCLPTSS